MGRLEGKVAIVTGAARGIGNAIASRLAGEGAIIAAADIDQDAGAAAIAALRPLSPKSRFDRLDIARQNEVLAFVERVAGEHGRLDILVNNAGITRQIPFFNLGQGDVDQIVDVNVKGTFYVMQAAARIMREACEGRIVNLSSIAGKGYRNTSNIAYAASKGAIIAMTRIAAAQLGRYGIAVNAVCPGITETELMGRWLEGRAAEAGATVAELRGALLAQSALGRMNSPADIAGAVLFLVSDEARNITGQSLNVDSGTMWD